MSRRVVVTDRAPAAVGPYAQAIVAGELIFCAGQIPLDPASGAFVGEGDVVAQARQVLSNLRGLLEAAGSGMDCIVKTTMFLVDMNDFARVNEVYAEAFAGLAPPARSTIGVAALPRGSRVEIEAVALLRS